MLLHMQDLKHLKSVPELVKASPEATQADAPLAVSPITLSPAAKEKPERPAKEAQEKASSFLADSTPPASRLSTSRYTQRALSPHACALPLCHQPGMLSGLSSCQQPERPCCSVSPGWSIDKAHGDGH